MVQSEFMAIQENRLTLLEKQFSNYQDKMDADFRGLTEAINKLTITLEKAGVAADGFKQVSHSQYSSLQALIEDTRRITLKNETSIDELSESINKAKGAASMAQTFWNIAWAIGGAVVAGLVWVIGEK